MIRPHVELSNVKQRSGSYANSINIVVDTVFDEIQISPSIRINISLPRFLDHRHIRKLIQDQLINHRWLAPKISRAATKLGFSCSELLRDPLVSHHWLSEFLASLILEVELIISVKITPPPSKEEVLTGMFQLGRMGKEDLKSSKMETEPCSICLDSVVSRGSNSKHGEPTRMTCSHVFHDGCLLVWLQRRNTCPLCRTVLYDRSMIGNKRG
ncbi:hypothetical protein Bca52824_001564 [Brassica carinata]|uniref:RING-type E3 ubiquitin transferase n=1 Tax=Brassica carinata TaxID=52824 RepID=A0A8X8B9V5_BRACI|nr:hypothetical protein Bca52824_001564 [Brassica carinata]